VPIVPCAIIGTSDLWLRRRITVRFGDAIDTRGLRGREAIAALDARVADAIRAMLPPTEPDRPRYRPMRWLTDLLE
jgi:1-acyl-sn-glycerol-3-phosphate acyltransferase